MKKPMLIINTELFHQSSPYRENMDGWATTKKYFQECKKHADLQGVISREYINCVLKDSNHINQMDAAMYWTFVLRMAGEITNADPRVKLVEHNDIILGYLEDVGVLRETGRSISKIPKNVADFLYE